MSRAQFHPISKIRVLALTAVLTFGSYNSFVHADNILFYGNSFTQGSGGSTDSVFNLVRDIATATGHQTPTVVSAAVGGKSFTWHLANNTSVISTALPPGQQWDYAVLQNFSTAPTRIGNLSLHRSDSVALYQEIANHSPSFTPVLFETWARAPGHSLYSGTNLAFPGGPEEMQAELRAGYQLAAQDINLAAGSSIARIAEVGDRWEDANWDNLHAGDLYHAQNRGTLLASLEIYSVIYQQPTGGIDLGSILSSLGLSESDGQFLTGIVDAESPMEPDVQQTVLFDFGASENGGAVVNHVTPGAQSLFNAIDTNGVATGIDLILDKANSDGFQTSFGNGSGTTSPASPALGFFNSGMTRDSLVGQDGSFEKAIFEITGLFPNTSYDYTFFASRSGSGENREASYDVDGNVVLLDAYGNEDNVAQLLGIVSDVNGSATLTIKKGPNNNNIAGYFYLGAMQISTSVVSSADFDENGSVDGRDFLLWQRGNGIDSGASQSQGDANGDGVVDGVDLGIWKAQFGNASVEVQAVPEPIGLTLGVAGLACFFLPRKGPTGSTGR